MSAKPFIPAAMPGPSPAGTGSGKRAAKGAYEFRFVEMGEPSGGCDKDSRSIVRAHVMRDSYIRRKQRTHRDSLPELIAAPPKCEDIPQQKFRFKLGPQGLEEVKKRRRRTKNLPLNDRLPATITPEASQNQVSAPNQPSSPQQNPSPNINHGDNSLASIEKRESLISDEFSVSPRSDRAPEFTRSNSLPAAVVGSGVLDPFNTLPTIECPRTEILLYHGTCNPNTSNPLLLHLATAHKFLRLVVASSQLQGLDRCSTPLRQSVCPMTNSQLINCVCDQPIEEYCRPESWVDSEPNGFDLPHRILQCSTLPSPITLATMVKLDVKTTRWRPYAFEWKP